MQKNYQQSLFIAKEIDTIGNELINKLTHFLKEVDSYSNTFFDQTFIAPNVKNDKDGTLTKKAIQKGESILDKITETLVKHEVVENLEEIVDHIVNQFSETMKEFKENIHQEKKELIETNNEILRNIKKLEKKKWKRQLKTIEDQEMKISLENTMKEYLITNIKSNKRKTIEEEAREKHLTELYNENLKEIFSLEEMKQLEEWTDLPIDSIVYDSNTEGIENCGYAGSQFQDSVLNKNNLIFFIEGEEGERFGYFMKNKINQFGSGMIGENDFLFTMNDKMIKTDIQTNANSQNSTIVLHSEQKRRINDNIK